MINKYRAKIQDERTNKKLVNNKLKFLFFKFAIFVKKAFIKLKIKLKKQIKQFKIILIHQLYRKKRRQIIHSVKTKNVYDVASVLKRTSDIAGKIARYIEQNKQPRLATSQFEIAELAEKYSKLQGANKLSTNDKIAELRNLKFVTEEILKQHKASSSFLEKELTKIAALDVTNRISQIK